MSKFDKWQAEAAVQGWTFVANIDGVYANYRHNVCEHKQLICFGAMRKGEVRCQHCKKQAWKAEAAAQGWAFERKVDNKHAFYTHSVCGQGQQVSLVNMRGGKVQCQHCVTQLWHNDATAQGWTFVAQTDGRNAIYTHNACGHKQQVQKGNMRNGEVSCHGCGESWATKPSNLYLLDITTACGQRFLKLGLAQIVNRRTQTYGLVKGASVEVLYAKAYATGVEACKVEKQLHKSATSIPYVKRFKGAKKLMDSGHTECYEYSSEAVGYLLLNLPN